MCILSVALKLVGDGNICCFSSFFFFWFLHKVASDVRCDNQAEHSEAYKNHDLLLHVWQHVCSIRYVFDWVFGRNSFSFVMMVSGVMCRQDDGGCTWWHVLCCEFRLQKCANIHEVYVLPNAFFVLFSTIFFFFGFVLLSQENGRWKVERSRGAKNNELISTYL